MSQSVLRVSSGAKKQKISPGLIVAGLGTLALLVGGFAFWRTMPPPPRKATEGYMGYPNGVWPARVQEFADRLVEVRADTNGAVRMFFMNARDKQFSSIEAPSLEGEIVSVNGDSSPFTLKPESLKGSKGRGSWLYSGMAPIERIQPNKWGLYGVRVTIPYNNANYSVRWKPEQTTVMIYTRHHRPVDVVMPAPPNNEVERKLFLEPGGKYTVADIAANGNAIASVRYRGIMAQHTMKPGKGAIICPITNTLANPQFTWIIDGKQYRFCCPPCIAEFVRQAKEKPKTIHPPEYYVAR